MINLDPPPQGNIFNWIWLRWFHNLYAYLKDNILKDFYMELAAGNISGQSVEHKFGSNPAVGTSFVPVCQGGVYQTPTSAVSLEFVSDNAADALDDTGMHELTIIGLDANWAEQTVVTAAHATNGTTAVAVSGTWLRVYRAYVSKSGTYATSAAASHVGQITIRVASAGATYAVIEDNDFPRGQTEIGAYTVPLGKTAYISYALVEVDANKTADVLFFQRPLANDTSSSYTGTMRVVFELGGIAGGVDYYQPKAPLGPFVGPCDLGFLAKVTATTGEVDVDFEIILRTN